MQSLAKPKTVAILLILFLGTYALLNATHLPFSIPTLQEASGGKTILNVLPYYDASGAYEHIAAYTAKALAIYYRILAIDVLVLIPIYVMFLTTGLLHAGSLVFRRYKRTVLQGIAMMPLVAGGLNLIEDGIVIYLIDTYPRRYETLAAACGYITATKSLLIVASLLAVAAFYLLIGYSRGAFSVGLRKCHI
jgi:hypothetical protein